MMLSCGLFSTKSHDVVTMLHDAKFNSTCMPQQHTSAPTFSTFSKHNPVHSRQIKETTSSPTAITIPRARKDIPPFCFVFGFLETRKRTRGTDCTHHTCNVSTSPHSLAQGYSTTCYTVAPSIPQNKQHSTRTHHGCHACHTTTCGKNCAWPRGHRPQPSQW